MTSRATKDNNTNAACRRVEGLKPQKSSSPSSRRRAYRWILDKVAVLNTKHQLGVISPWEEIERRELLDKLFVIKKQLK